MQSNKETIKKVLFEFITKNPMFDFSLLGGEFKNFHEKKKEATNYISSLLDNLDIRFIDNLNKDSFDFPKWFKDNNYYIDYNRKGELDFIIM